MVVNERYEGVVFSFCFIFLSTYQTFSLIIIVLYYVMVTFVVQGLQKNKRLIYSKEAAVKAVGLLCANHG